MIPNYLFDSDAWRSLRPVSQTVWLLIVRRYNGYNNGNIALSCKEVADLLGISKNTASRSFDDLMDKGFIKIGRDSSFDMKVGRSSRRWILTHKPIADQKGSGTNDWRKYKTEKWFD